MTNRRCFGWVLAVVVFVAAACVTPTAVSIALDTDALLLAPGEQADLVASVSGGGPFSEPAVLWTVEPSRLGAVDAHGHFRAGPRSGTGTVTATAGGASASATVEVTCPGTRLVRDISFNAVCTADADVYLESRMTSTEMGAMTTLIESDVTALERDFGRAFKTKALVYVFADPSSYVAGVRRILGDRAATLAGNSDGFFAPWVDTIAVDWHEMSRDVPVTALRHELTHRLIWQITGSPSSTTDFDGLPKERLPAVPTWLDEGLATVEESTVPGAEWMIEHDRVFAVGAYDRGALRLKDLVDLKKWNDRTWPNSFYQYLVAAQAVRQLESDIGTRGVVEILERARDGETFEAAYRAVSGFPFDSFSTRFSQRLRAGLSMPGVVGAVRREQSVIFVYGFMPEATVRLSFEGPASLVAFTQTDEYGNDVMVLGSAYPAGTYAVTASAGSVTRTFTITK